MKALPLLLLQLWSATAGFRVFLVDFNHDDELQAVVVLCFVVACCIVWLWRREALQFKLFSTELQV